MIRFALLALLALATPAMASDPIVAPVDPARVAPSRLLAAKIIPDGTYKRIMSGSMNGLMSGMFSQMLDLPAKQFVMAAGLPEADAAKLNKTTLRQIMAIVDPVYDERLRITTKILFDGMGDMLTRLEPDMREGLAQAYAARFDMRQLGEINAFLATPTGSAFAAQQLTIMTDPAMMQRMQAMLPTIMQQMPTLMKQVVAATASLPKPKTAADLTDADRAKLAQLLGVAPDKLKPKSAR